MVLVLLPYEITLFSNYNKHFHSKSQVLLPYEITLFSNANLDSIRNSGVLLPYEITLFSNGRANGKSYDVFYYLMKLHYSQTSNLK